jgi:trk system potassium uptake protein TrkH
VLLWRSVTQWLGGIGIVVLLVGIAPALGVGSTRALFAEVSGPTKERYTPRIADTARALVRIYVVLTAACFAAYVVTGMLPFDAANHAMTTVSTGGFSTHTSSLGFYEQAGTRMVSILFMLLGGVNFGLFIVLSMRRKPTLTQRYEFTWYLIALGAFSAIVAATLIGFDDGAFGESLLDSAFTVTSIITTTGYVTADFDTWNQTARTIVLAIMFVGGSAGSTVGGIKIFRWMMLGVSIRAELRRLMHPSAVISVRLGERHFTDRDLLTLMSFMVSYVMVFVTSAILVAAVSSLDLVSAISAAASSLTLVGPGLGMVGASESYSAISDRGLAVLTATMLLGRLEVFTVLALLTPAFWRRR